MRSYRIVPILIIICLLAQGAVPALAVCEGLCCAGKTLNKENQNQTQQSSVITHQCCITREVQGTDSINSHHVMKETDAFQIENKPFIPISLSYFRNYSTENMGLHSTLAPCNCVEGQSDSASDQKAVSAGLTRVEKSQLFVFLQDSTEGLLSQKFQGGFLSIKSRSAGSGLLTPIYLKNLSLLI
jgi:hypothetical protein